MRETTLILFIESLRQEYLAFPTKGNRLVTMKYLEKQGISKKDIVNYVEALKRTLKRDEYFTYFSLLKNKYYNLDPALKKVEDYNLDKELMISFVRNVPGIKKTTKGNLYRISKKATTIAEFVKDVAEKENINDPKVLKKFIKNNYGITIRKLEEDL